MKKNLIIGASLIVVLLIIIFAFTGKDNTDAAEIVVPVKKGEFVVDVITTGELEAKNSVEITGPGTLRDYRIYNVSIQHIIEEGKRIKKGDYVAQLDPSELNNRIKDAQIELEKIQSQYIQIQLDTTLQMRQARDELVNLKYNVEEKKIILEQSQFEPPATIKQVEIDVDKAIRALQQAEENYKIKLRQNVAKMHEVSASLRKQRNDYEGMLQVQKSFRIFAPEDGMLIYRKGWDGKPIKEGGQISTWDPVVATLPDLSVMMSKTYVNEVDVRKIKSGQKVKIGLDAFPEMRLTGVVTSVANVGEQRPNSDAKVFQVNVQVNESNELLKPSMTTSNVIVTNELENQLYIPLECLHNAFDSINFVYKKQGMNVVKQEVLVGITNANEAVIEKGINVDEIVYLSNPVGLENAEIALLPELDGKRNATEEEEVKPESKMKTITLPNGKTIEVPADTKMETRRFSKGDKKKSDQ
ncbi:MAG: efflux RND transporter periplasmic adaptor subunit [Candidatus Cyclobacteriaceae bacterium M2_1C_046]